MLCQKCNKNEANTYYSQVINGKKTEMYLCPQCAKEMSIGNFSFGGFGFGFPSLVRAAATERACPQCGATIGDISQIGRIGCANCYSFFEDELRDAIRRVHGDVTHKPEAGWLPEPIRPMVEEGRRAAKPAKPAKALSPLEQKREELKQAIAAEEFEKAAVLRDEIKKLEANQHGA